MVDINLNHLEMPESNEETLYFLRAFSRLTEQPEWQNKVAPWLKANAERLMLDLLQETDDRSIANRQGVLQLLLEIIEITKYAKPLARQFHEIVGG